MLIRIRVWTVELAKAWLQQHEWGHDFVRQLGENAGDAHSVRWLTMVVDMHAAMYSDVGAPGSGAGWGIVPGVVHSQLA